jgi:hypothetical protein
MIKNKLDNYLIPPKNGRLTHVNTKFYIKCPLGCNVTNQKLKDGKTKLNM